MSQRLQVLFVEDSEDDALLILHALARGGYDVDHQRVQTAADLSAALAHDQWDVVLSDFQMPNFTGPEAAAMVRDSGLELPFIILSGTVGEETAVEALRAGAHDFLIKGRLARLIPAIERERREAKVRRERR